MLSTTDMFGLKSHAAPLARAVHCRAPFLEPLLKAVKHRPAFSVLCCKVPGEVLRAGKPLIAEWTVMCVFGCSDVFGQPTPVTLA